MTVPERVARFFGRIRARVERVLRNNTPDPEQCFSPDLLAVKPLSGKNTDQGYSVRFKYYFIHQRLRTYNTITLIIITKNSPSLCSCVPTNETKQIMTSIANTAQSVRTKATYPLSGLSTRVLADASVGCEGLYLNDLVNSAIAIAIGGAITTPDKSSVNNATEGRCIRSDPRGAQRNAIRCVGYGRASILRNPSHPERRRAHVYILCLGASLESRPASHNSVLWKIFFR
jgi:hypothetical protein